MSRIKGKSFLIVDDEAELREILMEELAFHGAIVTGADRASVALELAKQQKFDAIISDFKMPGGDGLELFRNLKREIPELPKLFLCTGLSDIGSERQQELAITDIFMKPFSLEKVIQSIERLF